MAAGSIASTAIEVGAPLVIQLFQHIFDAIESHKHPSVTSQQVAETAASTTAKVIKSSDPNSTITGQTVANIVSSAVAAGTINPPGTTNITTVVNDAVKLGEDIK